MLQTKTIILLFTKSLVLFTKGEILFFAVCPRSIMTQWPNLVALNQQSRGAESFRIEYQKQHINLFSVIIMNVLHSNAIRFDVWKPYCCLWVLYALVWRKKHQRRETKEIKIEIRRIKKSTQLFLTFYFSSCNFVCSLGSVLSSLVPRSGHLHSSILFAFWKIFKGFWRS